MDRNFGLSAGRESDTESLSARRAWIEISDIEDKFGGLVVALRKESVDRNFYYSDKDADWVRSLSARRAWIEILFACPFFP